MTHTVRPPATIVRITARDNGFGWGDARIRAAEGLALSMVGLGAALAICQTTQHDEPTNPEPSIAAQGH